MDVDRVVHQAGKGAALDLNATPAVGEVQAIIVPTEVTSLGPIRHAMDLLKVEVLRVLGQDAEPGGVIDVNVLQRDRLAVEQEHARMVAGAVTQYEDVAPGRSAGEAVVQADESGRHFLGPVVVPATSEAAPIARVPGNQSAVALELHGPPPPALPALPDEDQLVVLDGIRRFQHVDLQVHVGFGDFGDFGLGGQGNVPVNAHIAYGHLLGMVHRERLHPVVENELGAGALDRQILELLDEDRASLGIDVRRVGFVVDPFGAMVWPEVVAALRKRQHRGLLETAGLQRLVDRLHRILAGVRLKSEIGDRNHLGLFVGVCLLRCREELAWTEPQAGDHEYQTHSIHHDGLQSGRLQRFLIHEPGRRRLCSGW